MQNASNFFFQNRNCESKRILRDYSRPQFEIPKMHKFLSLFVLMSAMGSASAHAEILRHDFTGTGSSGETAVGWFTWRPAVIANGETLATCGFGPCDFDKTINFEIVISGGTVVGGTTTFRKSDCATAGLSDAPDFVEDINFFGCDNGTNTLAGNAPYQARLNTDGFVDGLFSATNGTSTITFQPGTTSFVPTVPVPVDQPWPLALLLLSITLIAGWRLGRLNN